MTNIAIETGPVEIVSFPINSMVDLSIIVFRMFTRGYPHEIPAATQLLVILWRPIGAEVLPRGRGAARRGAGAALRGLRRLAPGEEQHADVVTWRSENPMGKTTWILTCSNPEKWGKDR